MNQRDKFIDAARKLGCDVDQEAFERAVRQVVRPQKDARKPARDDRSPAGRQGSGRE